MSAPKTIKSSSQYGRVYREGRRQAGEKVIIYYLETGAGGVIPGFVASRKNVGNRAVQRNRAKRLLREVFRGVRRRIAAENIWIVFIASFDPEETSFRDLMEDVEGSLARAGLIASAE